MRGDPAGGVRQLEVEVVELPACSVGGVLTD